MFKFSGKSEGSFEPQDKWIVPGAVGGGALGWRAGGNYWDPIYNAIFPQDSHKKGDVLTKTMFNRMPKASWAIGGAAAGMAGAVGLASLLKKREKTAGAIEDYLKLSKTEKRIQPAYTLIGAGAGTLAAPAVSPKGKNWKYAVGAALGGLTGRALARMHKESAYSAAEIEKKDKWHDIGQNLAGALGFVGTGLLLNSPKRWRFNTNAFPFTNAKGLPDSRKVLNAVEAVPSWESLAGGLVAGHYGGVLGESAADKTIKRSKKNVT